ncbi:MAG: rhodanese-like domain-containing protein [Bacteroidetes bacterium]|nr:MAG: rhodanese-like domain-containing protein [Bacteroidota bacterium]
MDITVQELRKKLEDGEEFVLIDVREPWESEQFNVGGQLIPIGSFMNRFHELDDHKTDEIVVYCRSGNRSGMAQALLRAQGYTNVRNLTGGMIAWQQAFGTTKP